jgi:hypothetical protein
MRRPGGGRKSLSTLDPVLLKALVRGQWGRICPFEKSLAGPEALRIDGSGLWQRVVNWDRFRLSGPSGCWAEVLETVSWSPCRRGGARDPEVLEAGTGQMNFVEAARVEGVRRGLVVPGGTEPSAHALGYCLAALRAWADALGALLIWASVVPVSVR